MQISEAAAGAPAPGSEPCRFPKLEECAHFHYERVQLPQLTVTLQSNADQTSYSQHAACSDESDSDWHMVQVSSGDECWLLQRNFENFKLLDAQLHQCIYDRKISQLPDLSLHPPTDAALETHLTAYLARFSRIADNSINCGPVLNWLQMDNKGHRLLVPSEESRSINTPAVAAAYSVRRYVSQARDELNLEVGDMISVIDMASPGESMWWRGKRGFQVGFFPQHCVHIIGDKVPRNMPLPPPVVGSLALSPIKPVLRKHGKLITFFRSFILNRPSRRRLKASGILKERVFGCDLGEHLLNSGQEIPMVLKCCAEFIETHGIVDGIYRLSGVTSNIQKLRNAFDEDRIPNLYTEDILQDIHSVASLLKMYFRELPNPLCTYQLYQSFVNAVQGCKSAHRSTESDHDRLLKMREAVQKLPPPHYRTLEYLMRHLAKVAKHGVSTGMTTRNVAIVWAPNLLRCAELEVGGVAALQGVGVQAVVTEFLICYANLIFCDHLPSLDLPGGIDVGMSPKRCRPKSLAISTPTKLITLEEARSKHLVNKSDDFGYIEVGGGPKNLPKKYHTVIEMPSGGRKRGLAKGSPSGWRSFFSKARNSSQGSLAPARKVSTPGIGVAEKSVTESDLTEMRRKLRSVKSAESLTSGHSEPACNELDVLGPLYCLNKPQGHNRSVSHDSYFDTLQNSQNNSENSLLDLSEIQLNFELEESEMRIFSEDESLVSSPRTAKDPQRRILTRARPEEFSSAANSGNPSPKKQARVVLSPDAMSRKRTRLEDQLSDIQYIDCATPDLTAATTAAVVHVNAPATIDQPKNKSPRNSDNLDDKRQSLNLEAEPGTPTPLSPAYRELGESSTTNTTPDFSPTYQNLSKQATPTYENILTTISITYKSPSRSIDSSPIKNITSPHHPYENVLIPTSTASLPCQEAAQPPPRPRSLNALDDSPKLRPNLSSSALCTSSHVSLGSYGTAPLDSNQSSRSNVEYTPSFSSLGGIYYAIDNSDRLSLTDLSLSEVVGGHSSSENLDDDDDDNTSLQSPSKCSPLVSPTLYDFSEDFSRTSTNDKRKSTETLEDDDNGSVYQQVKFFRRSIHEVNAMIEPPNDVTYDSLEAEDCHVYENVEEAEPTNQDQVGVEAEPEVGVSDAVVAPLVVDVGAELEVGVANDVVGGATEEGVVFVNEAEPSLCVKDLTNRFEDADAVLPLQLKSRRVYDKKEALPPCLRARNLKNQLKTRSLDDEEFKKEFNDEEMRQRRMSVDEAIGGYKTNSLPKTLNQPKSLPGGGEEGERLSSMIHLAHSSENVSLADEEQKKRERIEKYKEERRKFLHEKYRSESFKENKDVLLSQLKIFKVKDEPKPADEAEILPRARRKSTRSDDGVDDAKAKTIEAPKPPITESLKSRAAIFEQSTNQRVDFNKNHNRNSGKVESFVRVKKEEPVGERRRHTYENRERECDSEIKRGSLDGKRREKTSPTYCIKDMKAIFESKSKQ